MTHPTYIEGEIKMSNGSRTKFSIQSDCGWQQWGGSGEELGETVELMEALAAAAYESGLRDADEPEEKYPGICWPTWADGTDAPEGWSWVERDDEAELYESDEAAARALIDKHGISATEVRWFNRYTHEPIPGNEYVTEASVAINVPDPTEEP